MDWIFRGRFKKWFPDLRFHDVQRVQSAGKRINEKVEILDDNRSELSDVQSLQPVKKRKKSKQSLCSKQDQLTKLKEWVIDDDITTICIYGMGGVGKTTLAKQLETQISEYDKSFGIHSVCLVSVGMNFSTYQLQQKIADAFKIDLCGDKDETRRAGMINKFLSSNQKCVLLLDDFWSDFRREEVGIPKKCTLVLISPSLEVCHALKCDEVLKVEPLSEDESLQLFSDSLGFGLLDSKVHPHIRKCLYDKCGGLPLAITVLVKSLRKMVDDNASTWREIFESTNPFWKGSTYLEDVISRLKLSYNSLNNSNLQKCFLYSAIFPKDYAINREKLIRLWIAAGLIDDVESLQAQYDMGHTILNKLLNSCLMETCQDETSVKMHELVRQMALSVNDSYMVYSGAPSKVEFSEKSHVVSMINSSISLIPSSIPFKCTNLSALLLQSNSFKAIPDSFFQHMRSLRVLNLSDTGITRLPNSIDALVELRHLDLSYCQNLKQVPHLAKLLKLQFLDLSQTAIGQVPCSLEKLKRLKELNLSSIPKDTKIPSEVFLALFRLKRLACHVVGGAVNELQKMVSLEILEAKFFSLCDFNNYVRSQHWCILDNYYLQVGIDLGSKEPYSRRVSLHHCAVDNIKLPSNIQELYVDDCTGFRTLSDVIRPALYHKNDCEKCTSGERCDGEQNEQAEAFSSLEKCTIRRCADVEIVFAPSWVENLKFLESLKVEDCGELKELIAQEEGCNMIRLPRLRWLTLTLLPQMNSIKYRVVCPSLVSYTCVDCPQLKSLTLSCSDDGDFLRYGGRS
ncbi:unnamed protein product [Amaranthus hypochondriacus]